MNSFVMHSQETGSYSSDSTNMAPPVLFRGCDQFPCCVLAFKCGTGTPFDCPKFKPMFIEGVTA